MTTRFRDVSHHDYDRGDRSLAGETMAVIKHSQGVSYRDPRSGFWRDQAIASQVPFAGYHWLDEGDLAGQVANYHAAAGATPCMWDAEAPGATVSRIVVATWLLRAAGGRPVAVYLPHWWWENLASPDLTPLRNAGLFLISSNYPAAGYTPTGPGWTPYGGLQPDCWQYTDIPHDINAFRGTTAALLALWGLTSGGTMTTPDQAGQIHETWNLISAGHRDGPSQTAGGGVPISYLPQQFYLLQQQLTALQAKVDVITGASAPPALDPAAVAQLVVTDLRAELAALLTPPAPAAA